MDKLIIMACDPSIRGWGYVVINTDKNILSVGCIKTEPKAKKLRIRKGDDDIRRISEINLVLIRLIKHYKVNYVVSELPHGSQSASSAQSIGTVKAILQTICDCLSLSIDWYSESDAKLNLLNKRTATKDETIQAISKLYKVPWTKIAFRDEAIADSLAIFHVARVESATLKMFM